MAKRKATSTDPVMQSSGTASRRPSRRAGRTRIRPGSDRAKPTPAATDRSPRDDQGQTRSRPAAQRLAQDEEAVSTTKAAKMLGVTSAQFRRIAIRCQIVPVRYCPNPHYRSGPECPMWALADARSPKIALEVAEFRKRARKQKEAKAAKPASRAKTFSTRYPNWRDALPSAARALFNLSRFAKYDSCTRERRDRIYRLKGRFIHLLYCTGMCVEARRHVQHLPEQECYGCRGYGDNEFGECRRCGGFGVYRVATDRVSVVFRFDVAGQTYSWHQPEELVTWPYELTADDQDWVAEQGAKPVECPLSQLPEAGALLEWVVTRWSESERRNGVPERAVTRGPIPDTTPPASDVASSGLRGSSDRRVPLRGAARPASKEGGRPARRRAARAASHQGEAYGGPAGLKACDPPKGTRRARHATRPPV